MGPRTTYYMHLRRKTKTMETRSQHSQITYAIVWHAQGIQMETFERAHI